LQLNELQLSKYDNHYQKLKLIFERTIESIPIIQTRLPLKRLSLGKCAVDVKLGRAQGVAMAAALERHSEYEPKKMAITGNGNATKEQVAKMLQLLGLKIT
jgi:crossover junction endodeoxyribonuclease RuvC